MNNPLSLKTLILVITGIFWQTPGFAQLPNYQPELSLGVENFTWKEFRNDGFRLLKENGYRFSVNAGIGNLELVDRGLILGANLKGYAGRVDYDGHSQSTTSPSTLVDFFSETDYTGFNLEVQGGYRIDRVAEMIDLDLLISGGIEKWKREIFSGLNILNQPVSGDVEKFTVQYARYGIGIRYTGEDINIYSILGLKKTLHVDEKERNFNITLSPGSGKETVSFSITALLKSEQFGIFRNHFIEAYYEAYRLEESPSVLVNNSPIIQPKSDLDVIGVYVGRYF
ncbi:MAG: hypothetical protein ACE5EH_04435 [Gammaproteobacteria bacterium]